MRLARSIDAYRLPPRTSASAPQGAAISGASTETRKPKSPVRSIRQTLQGAAKSKTFESAHLMKGASKAEDSDAASDHTEPPLSAREVDSAVDTNTDVGTEPDFQRSAKRYLSPSAVLLQNYRFRALPGVRAIPALKLVPRDADAETASEAGTEPPDSARNVEAAGRTSGVKVVSKSMQTDAALVLSEADLNDRMLEAFQRINWEVIAERREDKNRSWCCTLGYCC